MALTVDLNRVLGGLPEKQRQAIALRIFDDLSNEQIARVMGLSVSRATKVLSEAVKELRARLTGQPITWTIPTVVRELETAA